MSDHRSRRSQTRKDQAAGGQPEKDSRVLIAMVGVTGAGKTTFASLASGDKTLKIGHSVDPCELAISFSVVARPMLLD